MWDIISKIITWAITSFGGIIGIVKTFSETKKLLEKDVMPDIKTEDKAEEIVKKQELAHHLVILAGLEAAYNVARGLVVAFNFALLMHYSLKFAQSVKRKESSE